MSEPARDRLTLGSVEARCQFVGPAADGYAAERRLDRIAREALPDALAAAVAQRLGPRDGVIRIDRIELDLMLSREMFESSALPRLWADRIGSALATALARSEGANIVHFASHAEFAAAYLEHRFGVAGHPPFAFDDFAPLSHVTPEAAAVELLAARPDILAALARRGGGRGDPAWLARHLGTEPSARILDRAGPSAAAAGAAALALVRRLIAHAPPGWRALPGAAAALALLLGGLAEPAPDEGAALAALVPLARAVAAVAHLASAVPELLELIEAEDSAGALEFLALSPAQRRETGFARSLFAGRAGKRVAAAVHAGLGTRRGAEPEPSTPGGRRAKRRDAAPQPKLDSPFAGFALLLPTLRGLAIDTLLSPGQARALIIAALDPPDRMAPHAEALADLLLPLPIEPELPLWPRAAPGDPASAGVEAWAARLLDAFAHRLPGLRGSSGLYLRRQFLQVSGTLELEPERLTVRLMRPPLAIVLTIAGMTGEQGPLPWRRERGLRILMP
jgi:hypothetical protein